MKYHFPSSSNPLWWSSLLGVAFGRSSTTVARSFADTIAHGTDKVYEQRKNAKRIHLQTRRHNALSSTIISFQTTPGKEPDPKDILHFKVRSYLLVLIMFMFVFTFYFTVHSLTSIHFQLMTGMQQRFRSRIWLQAWFEGENCPFLSPSCEKSVRCWSVRLYFHSEVHTSWTGRQAYQRLNQVPEKHFWLIGWLVVVWSVDCWLVVLEWLYWDSAITIVGG
jgi:hypothetical protein